MNFVVGLTGGIGSGKSTVAELFAARGAAIVDTDHLAHQLTAAGGAAMPAIRAAFGAAVLTPTGALDRVTMRQRVFTDPSLRHRLESILHPLIRTESATCCAAAMAPYVILAVPLLIESGGWRTRCHRVLVVDCLQSQQIARVCARSGMTVAEVEAILAVQASREARLAAADDVIDNAGEHAGLVEQVESLHQSYLDFALEVQAAC